MKPEHFIEMSYDDYLKNIERYKERSKRSFKRDNLDYARRMGYDEGPVPRAIHDAIAWDFGAEVWEPGGDWDVIWSQIVNGDRDVRYIDTGPTGGRGGIVIFGLNAGCRRHF